MFHEKYIKVNNGNKDEIIGFMLKPGTHAGINNILIEGTNAFDWCFVPSITDLISNITEETFHLVDVESLRRHYGRTSEHWSYNFEHALSKIRKSKEEAFIRMWRLYLNACATSFHVGNIDVHQFVFSKGLANVVPWASDYLFV